MGTVGLVVLYCDHLRSVTNNFARLFISAFPSTRQVQPHQITKLQPTAQEFTKRSRPVSLIDSSAMAHNLSQYLIALVISK